MDASLPVPLTKEQTTVTARILRIVLDEIALLNDRSNLTRSDHSLRPRHLPNGVGQEEQALRSSAFDLLDDPFRSHWSDRPLASCFSIEAK